MTATMVDREQSGRDRSRRQSAGADADERRRPESLHFGKGVFTAVPDRPRTWSYRATRISLAPNADGRGRQLSVIEAGSFAMVSLTTELSLSAADAEAARRALADHEGCAAEDIVLVPAELDVRHAAVLLGDGTGVFERLATAGTSGYHPHAAVFSATLDGPQLAKVKKGLGGQRSWFAAEYEFTERPRPSTRGSTSATRVTEESSVTTVRHGSPNVAQSTSTHRATTRTSGAESSEGELEPPAPERIRTDAAEWDLGSR